MNTLKFCLLAFGILTTTENFSQRNHGHHGGYRHHNKVMVVRRSPFRPTKIVVYHPSWGPSLACQRRWVFFPKYNLYWDNWRNHYVFLNAGVWVSQAMAPPFVVNVNLGKAKYTELRDSDDDTDDIYNSNVQHRSQYGS
jgi:hypothetical protein